MENRWQQLIKRFHPEGIPWPGSVLYNMLSSTGIFLKHYELVAQDIANYKNISSVLDIGTGPGRLLLAMHKVFPEARLVGVDISPAMVLQAKRNLRKSKQDRNINLQVADANALPFAEETFSCVVSTGSFHHWKDPIQALSETYRVLKAGGYAFIYDLARDIPKILRKDVRARFGGFRLAILWLHSFEEPFLNAEEMQSLGRRSDFLVEGTRFTGALCCLMLKKADVSTNN